MRTVHISATLIFKCAHSSYIWQGNEEQCNSFAPGLLKIEEDADHRVVTLPDLVAVTLHFDPEQQHHATVPGDIQVDQARPRSRAFCLYKTGAGGTKKT